MNLVHHLDKAHGTIDSLKGKLERHEVLIETVGEHALCQGVGIATGMVSGVVDHYLGQNNSPAEVFGIPVVGLGGLALGGVALALGTRPLAPYLNAAAIGALAVGSYNLVGDALANLK